MQTAPLSSPAYAAARRKRLHQVLILLLCLVTLLVYSNSFRCGFTLDNAKMILSDGRITAVNRVNLALIASQGYWFPIETSGLYRPFATLSYLFNFAVLGNGARPAGYHAVNLALEWLDVALVYLLACHLFGEIGLAFGTAALWAVHPLLTESVTNIVGRTDLLAGAAIVGGLLCYIRVTEAGFQLRWIAALAAVTVIGIFSKESVVVLPGLMAAYDFTFHRKTTPARLCAYAVVLLPLLFWWWMRSLVVQPYAHPFVDNPLQGADFWTAKLTVVKIAGKYLWLFLFPRTLSSDYSYNQIPLMSWRFDRWEDWQALPAAGACALLVWLAMVCRRGHKPLFFLLVFSAMTYVPTSNLLVQIGSIMAERFMYLPAIGLSACVVAGLAAAGRRLRSPALAPVTITILCLVLGCRTFARNHDWRNDETLASSEVAASPASFKSHMFLAMSLPAPSALDRSVAEIGRALEILNPLPDAKNVAIAYNRAGQLYREKGQWLEANAGDGAPWYRKARDVLLRGVAIDRVTNGRYRELWLRRGDQASRIPDTGLVGVYRQLGLTYIRLREPRLALDALRYGQKLAPDSVDLYVLIADAYSALHDDRQQAIALLEGLLLRPGDRRLADLLPRAYARVDTGGCRAFSVEPATGKVHMNLNCPVAQEQSCAAAENLVRRLIGARQEAAAERIREQALASLGCPLRQFDFTIQ